MGNVALEMPDGGPEESVADVAANVTPHPRANRDQSLRIMEAILFAADGPLALADIARHLPESADAAALLRDLQANYAHRGVNIVEVAGKWMLRTAEDLSFLLRREHQEQRKLSRAALETLAIVAYHQPVTRAEIEDIRGVAISRGTLDQLVDIGWVRMRGRRKTPGRPVTYGTTEAFLVHFGLASPADLPGVAELKAAGLLDSSVPADFVIPMPKSDDLLRDDEDPLDGTETQMPLDMDLPEEPAEAPSEEPSETKP
jgi:segregation and condensation protein B